MNDSSLNPKSCKVRAQPALHVFNVAKRCSVHMFANGATQATERGLQWKCLTEVSAANNTLALIVLLNISYYWAPLVQHSRPMGFLNFHLTHRCVEPK